MILFGSQHKAELIDLFHRALKLCVYHGTTPQNIQALEAYIEWMKKQPEDLACQVNFESYPERRATQLTMNLAFVQTTKERSVQ